MTADYVKGGETIQFTKPQELTNFKKYDLDIKIIYEDEYLAAINKSAGVLVSGNNFKTIANALNHNIKASKLPDAVTPHPVHRLDFPTTGILLIGKTSNSIRAFNKMFESNNINKTYYAITIGEMEKEGTIITEVDGKNAETNYTLCHTVLSNKFTFLNLVKLKPITGRRHQLRKHLLAIGNPILGDRQYNLEKLVLKGKGLYLHAHSVTFVHPFNNELISIKASLPNKFKKIFTMTDIY